MRSCGQGAMEYLMSYGWAVLVVLVVGVTIWQLGVFSFGGTIPPTSTGFQAIKPLTATCELKKCTFDATVCPAVNELSGFTCQFVNSAGGDIQIQNVDVKTNGKYCREVRTQTKPEYYVGITYTTAYKTCVDEDICPWGMQCALYIDLGVWQLNSGPRCSAIEPPDFTPRIIILSGEQFTVMSFSRPGEFGPCRISEQKPGQVYDVNVDIEYRILVGGIWVTKHSNGVVRLTPT